MLGVVLALAVLTAAFGLAGCGSGSDSGAGSPSRTVDAETGDRASGPVDPDPEPQEPEAKLAASHCPPELPDCVVASGRVIYVEAVDPDGDGDAHFVTSSRQGVTLPGITVFDVSVDLRPDPLPGVGDLVGGAGPVYPGSKGQKQIEVVEFHVAR